MWNISLNCTNNDSCVDMANKLLDQSSYHLIPLDLVVALLILILIVDLIGNTVVVLVIVLKRRMQTFTNWLILNLAVADLSVAIICIPLEIPLELNKKWIYGSFFCRIFYPIESATIYGSVFTLVVLSCSRYWAIIHPYRTQPTTYGAKVSICAVWVSSFVFVSPYMMGLKYDSKDMQCVEVWSESHRRIYTTGTFTMQYLLPLTIIIVAYAFIIYEITLKKNPSASLYEDKNRNQESKKLIKLLLIITITFALCVLPYHIVALCFEFGQANHFKYIEDISIASYILLYLNSALNPVIYNVFSSSFREAFAEWYKKIWNQIYKGNGIGSRYAQTKSADSTITYQQQGMCLTIIQTPTERKISQSGILIEVAEDGMNIGNGSPNGKF